jgi:hypothetical protein
MSVQKYLRNSAWKENNMAKTPAGAKASAYEVHVPKDDSADRLHQFGQCASVLRDLLYDDRALDEEEFIFIEKHFQILNMAYLRWKRKHRPTDEAHPLI